MGTSIELELGGISLDYAKNHMGNDHGFLFQESDRTRRHADGIDYDYFAEHSDDEELGRNEACFVRPLRRVLPRLDLLGQTVEAARSEYEAVVGEALEYSSTGDDDKAREACGFMSFEEFCDFCNRFKIEDLDSTYIEGMTDGRDRIARGRFDALAEELSRIPHGFDRQLYWSERSFFGSAVCILSAYSMFQVFGRGEANLDVEVMWQFGPIVEAGWVTEDSFHGGAGRRHSILVATEGTSDARILRRAIDILNPDVADFFRFIDVDQSHPFPGTGNLVKFAEGLVHIDVQNRILFVLDNDAEGLAGFRRIEAMQKPVNMRVMMLPHLEEFKGFPARGPEGINPSDINERGAAIECYLDLRLAGRPDAEVIWSNYKREIDRWHGALDHKDTYTRRFLEQSDESLRDGSYDTRKLEIVLSALIVEATALAVGDFAPADGD
jgi:hypothetical protein